ncbi:MAG: FACT complex subunit [Pycnora praestabilis]|nr:MAG: FACT complex subunit [Pycnora praestabilis]
MGWKPSGAGDTFTLDHSNIGAAQWSRAARGFELKLLSRNAGVIQLDGFQQEDLERLSKAFKLWYGVNLEHKEHALRGWNWGKGEFGKVELAFNVQNRPAFEIPYSEISNTNLAGKNEVAVEFSLPANGEETGTNGHLGGARGRGRKAGGGRDQLVEMRFYIPGTATKKETDEDGEDKSVDGEDAEEQNAANLFYDTLMEKADIGEVAGDTYATFLDILHLTPRFVLHRLLLPSYLWFMTLTHGSPKCRGRYDIDMYESSFRLRGKTYDYKIQYESIKKFMVLPKPDDQHTLITIGLDPPLRQGQTRYPFLVMQFKRDEEVTIDLNMTEELLNEKYNGKLQSHYENPIHAVVAQVFRGLSGKKIITPSKEFIRYKNRSYLPRKAHVPFYSSYDPDYVLSAFSVLLSRGEEGVSDTCTNVSANTSSHHQQSGVKCSIKANEGHLFCLDKSFMFVPKPATYISFDNISSITMSRVGGAISASRTFDITVTLKGGQGEHQFSNINREEQQPLEEFFKIKNLRTKNEMVDDVSPLTSQGLPYPHLTWPPSLQSSALIAAALQDEDMASSDEEVVAARADRGSADEDEESVDDDFHASDSSDVAEEFDSAHESSGGEDDAEMGDADAAGDSDPAVEERPKKKVKTAK